MKLYALKTKTIKKGDNLVEVILKTLKQQKLQLDDHDILALTSKIVSYSEGRLVKLENVKSTLKAERFAEEYSLQAELAELILQEAEKIFGGVKKAVLTLKNGVLTPNAGIDNKNAPIGFVILWPTNIIKWVKSLRDEIIRKTKKQIGLLIIDSTLAPLRLGTRGLALATAGFKPIKDCRGKKDIFGKPLVLTLHSIADDLASAAHLLMGEVSLTPIVLIKEAPVISDNKTYSSYDMMIPFKECIFTRVLWTASRDTPK
jgi:coenzyme F420-0:L-glutamate ligase